MQAAISSRDHSCNAGFCRVKRLALQQHAVRTTIPAKMAKATPVASSVAIPHKYIDSGRYDSLGTKLKNSSPNSTNPLVTLTAADARSLFVAYGEWLLQLVA
jgi:hypothetical protein